MPSIRRSKRLLLLLIPIVLFLIFLTLGHYEKLPPQISPEWSFLSLGNKFNYSYLGSNNTNSVFPVMSTYEELGFQLVPEDVKFQYINKMGKKGSPKDILKINMDKYKSLMDQEIHEPKDFDMETIRPPQDPKSYDHASATIVSLVRGAEAAALGKSIVQFEKKFNSKFLYPYTFINDVPFTDSFKERMRKYSLAPMNFVTIPAELWDKPESIDEAKERKAMDILASKDVSYAKKASYHNMCRFYTGNFYQLEEMKKYKYYWRIEPGVKFYSDINYDIFKYLEGTKKIYGFTINLYDIDESVETLWPETLKYLNSEDNYKYVNVNGAFQWILENQQLPKKNRVTGGYSTCHFWSNFEIGDMDFFRGEAYTNWFKFLDSTGKFYYERWGDAPVHSLGLALFADKKDIHWFRDIGYWHDPYANCPNSKGTLDCEKGLFSRWDNLNDQNCMATWVDDAIENPEKIY